jgi:two-component system cell cycle response regulator DivK
VEQIKILCVEDHADNRLLVRRVLEAEGYAVLEAESGAKALELLEQEIPALILMDIHLGEIDGYTLTEQLRQRDDLQAVPIVALTAFALEGDRERALEAGCDGYIQKPIDVDTLPYQIATFLRQTRYDTQ